MWRSFDYVLPKVRLVLWCWVVNATIYCGGFDLSVSSEILLVFFLKSANWVPVLLTTSDLVTQIPSEIWL